MMPPLAFSSSTAMVAPHTTPSPVMADGPLIADAKPTRTGWAQAGAAATTVINSARMIPMCRLPVSPWSADDREVLARAREPPRAAGGDLHGVLHLDAAPAVLIVGRLHAEDHAGLEQGRRRRVDRGRVIGLEPDAVAHVVALIVRDAVLAGHAHGDLEDVAHGHARSHGSHGRLLAGQRGRVVPRLLLARPAEDGRPRDVRAVALVDAAQVAADEVAGPERALGGVDVRERGPLADRDHGEEGRGAAAQHLLLVDPRRLALGHARLEHPQDGGDAVLGDERGALQPRDLLAALHHPRPAQELVGGGERRSHKALVELPPR